MSGVYNSMLSQTTNTKEYCNDDTCVDRGINGIHNEYCFDSKSTSQCQSLSLATQQLACPQTDDGDGNDRQSQIKQLSECSPFDAMDIYDKHSEKTLIQVWHIQCTIVVTLIAIALARLLLHQSYASLASGNSLKSNLWFRYLSEFCIIALPVIVSVNVANGFVDLIVFSALGIFIVLMCHTNCWFKAESREFEFGRRPALFTLLRSTISFLTALCILAIDFESFPKTFRKSRRYGAGLMDVGIGLFVFSMGLVSSRPRRLSDLRKLIFTVGCLLFLGLARTVVITAIDYHQDEHEYGVHLNAFFTLGFTKLFATLLGFAARSDKHLLPLGLVILIIHQLTLHLGLGKYVMNPNLGRGDFLTANREGLCSLPGFIALYILSQFIGQWIQEEESLEFDEIKRKFKQLSLASFVLWLIVVISIFLLGIARVTCNMGYVAWILAIAVTMCTLYLFVFDIVLDTLKPANTEYRLKLSSIEMKAASAAGGGSSTKLLQVDSSNTKIPLLIESVNYNGLTFFLLANVLTGATNIFLNTDEKSDIESVFILFIYMFITTTVAFLLYRFKIRIA